MDHPVYTLRQLILYFLKLGAIGFGGPVALVGYMHRDLVEQNKWITDEDYKEGLALAQLAPGPLAAQLSIYMGYIHYRIIGATLTGLAFVLPSFIMVTLLGIIYVQAGGLPWMLAVFYGVGACVIGIIVHSSYRLTKKNLGRDPKLWVIFLCLAVTTYLTENENIWMILGSGFLVLLPDLLRSSPKKQTTLFVSPVFLQISWKFWMDHKLIQIGWFFLKAGTFVFGSGLAIVPFLYGGLVKEFHWLNEQQFLDAVAVAMITPGPVVITVGFIGYLIGGLPGACMAALATFIPCYVFTIIPAPYFKKHGKKKNIKKFVDGVTAAAIGAIAGAVGVLAKRQVTDLPSLIIVLTTIVVLFRVRKIPEPVLILAAAVTGIILELS